MTRVAIFHNIPAPYRIPLFDALAGKYDLLILFSQAQEKGRLWSVNRLDMKFPYVFLDEQSFELFGKNIVININIGKVLDDFNPEVVIGHDNPPNILTTLWVASYCRRRNIPFILWTGNFPGYTAGRAFYFRLMGALLKSIRRLVYRRAQAFCAYGEETKRLLMHDFGVPPGDIFTGTQGYPEILFQPFFQIPNLETKWKNNVILFIGYLRSKPDKGVKDLIFVFKQLINDGIRAKLVIIGDGERRQALESFAGEYPVCFLGHQEKQEKYRWLYDAKVLILPSKSDSWGWVVNEAMFSYLPVIVSNSAMAKEMVNHGKNGYIYSPNDLASLSHYLKTIMTHNFTTYQAMCHYAFQVAQNYGLARSLNCFQQSIAKVSL